MMPYNIQNIFASIPSKMDTSDNNAFPKSEMYECSNQTSGIRGRYVKYGLECILQVFWEEKKWEN
jgi:hypothetical protein